MSVHIKNLETGKTFQLLDKERATVVFNDKEQHEFHHFSYKNLLEMLLSQPKRFEVKQQ